MFNNLIESQAKREKRAGGLFLSFVVHSAMIAGAVYATAGVTEAYEKIKAEKVEFLKVEKEKEPPPPKEEPKVAPPPDVVAAPPPPKGFQILTAPIKIPDVLPDIDLTKQVTREEDFSGRGVAGGTAKGVVGGVPQAVSDQPLFDFQVEVQVKVLPNQQGPDYPGSLRANSIEGNVMAQFVVDTTGRADMSTFREMSSSHALFTNAVRNHLPKMRFSAAEIGGKKVKQLVQMPFVFTLSR